jgi:NAD(P)-dependent dehydrogenase (short-subunit alcohol dehydrogenase family)
MKPVCLVIGAGAGIGGNVGRRFANEGYHAVLCWRSDRDGLDCMVADVKDSGGSASGSKADLAPSANEVGPYFNNGHDPCCNQVEMSLFVQR